MIPSSSTGERRKGASAHLLNTYATSSGSDRDKEGERELERLLLEGLKSGNAKDDVKALFRRLHARVDEVEAESKRNGKAARPKTRR